MTDRSRFFIRAGYNVERSVGSAMLLAVFDNESIKILNDFCVLVWFIGFKYYSDFDFSVIHESFSVNIFSCPIDFMVRLVVIVMSPWKNVRMSMI